MTIFWAVTDVTLVNYSWCIPVLQKSSWHVFGYVAQVTPLCFVSLFVSAICTNIEEPVYCRNSDFNISMRLLFTYRFICMAYHLFHAVELWPSVKNASLKWSNSFFCDVPISLPRTFQSSANCSTPFSVLNFYVLLVCVSLFIKFSF